MDALPRLTAIVAVALVGAGCHQAMVPSRSTFRPAPAKVAAGVKGTPVLEQLAHWKYGDSTDAAALRDVFTAALDVDGDRVTEVFNSLAKRRIAVAQCVATAPVIYYSAPDVGRLTARSLVFFRTHEWAHLLKRHDPRCQKGGAVPGTKPGSKPADAGQREREADCYAVHYLNAAGPAGHDALVAAAEVLRRDNLPEVNGYPSGAKRAQYLMNDCS